jgi:hypothetical protein
MLAGNSGLMEAQRLGYPECALRQTSLGTPWTDVTSDGRARSKDWSARAGKGRVDAAAWHIGVACV